MFLGLLAQASASEDKIKPDPNRRLVNISIELHGLEQSAALVQNAALRLASSLERASRSPQSLSPEQLREIGVLAAETNQLVENVSRTVAQIPQLAENLSEPAGEVAASARIGFVDPILRSLDQKVSLWIRLVVIGLILLSLIVGFVLFRVFKQVRLATDNLKIIADQYTIVKVSEPEQPG